MQIAGDAQTLFGGAAASGLLTASFGFDRALLGLDDPPFPLPHSDRDDAEGDNPFGDEEPPPFGVELVGQETHAQSVAR